MLSFKLAHKNFNAFEQFFFAGMLPFTFLCPQSPWMANIPVGHRLFIPATSRIMIPKPINQSIPERLVSSDQSGFDRANQIAFCSFKNHKPATVIVEFESSPLLNTSSVLSDSIVEFVALTILCICGSSLPPTSGDSFSYVDWHIIGCSINVMEIPVNTCLCSAINSIYASSMESLRCRYYLNRCSIEEQDSILDYFFKVWRVEDMFVSVKLHRFLYSRLLFRTRILFLNA